MYNSQLIKEEILMNFNEKQAKEINEFIMKYNSDEEFKNSIQQLYDDNTYKLSILQIYALEEILRYGAEGYFKKFITTKGTYSEEQAVELYDGFIKLLNEDANFKQYKMRQLKEAHETLSALEMFAFTLISGSKEQREQMHKEMTDELEYDPLNPILYSTDEQIRETLENLFFGSFIHELLEEPSMKPIKVRQKENGRIANSDKTFIIERIRGVVFEPNSMAQFKQIIDSRFIKAKMDLLLNNNDALLAFGPYLKYNTNISASEILGKEKNNIEQEAYDFFTDVINRVKK